MSRISRIGAEITTCTYINSIGLPFDGINMFEENKLSPGENHRDSTVQQGNTDNNGTAIVG